MGGGYIYTKVVHCALKYRILSGSSNSNGDKAAALRKTLRVDTKAL
jgi:hypothetical protein